MSTLMTMSITWIPTREDDLGGTKAVVLNVKLKREHVVPHIFMNANDISSLFMNTHIIMTLLI